MRISTTLLSLSFSCFLPAGAVLADTITAPMLPAAALTQYAEIPTGANTGGETFGAYTVAQPSGPRSGPMSAATSAYGGTDPSVTAAVSFSGASGLSSGAAMVADSELVYYVEVAGPSGTPVPVQLSAAGRATSTDSRVSAYASLDIVGVPNTDHLFGIAACGSGGFTFCNATPNPQQFQVNTILQLTPNEIYEVVLEANIESGSFYGPLPSTPFLGQRCCGSHVSAHRGRRQSVPNLYECQPGANAGAERTCPDFIGSPDGDGSPEARPPQPLPHPVRRTQREPTMNERMPQATQRRRHSPWLFLLLLPYAGLCFPGLYVRATPALFGFPFFYWYQFAWVLATSLLLGIVYRVTKD